MTTNNGENSPVNSKKAVVNNFVNSNSNQIKNDHYYRAIKSPTKIRIKKARTRDKEKE